MEIPLHVNRLWPLCRLSLNQISRFVLLREMVDGCRRFCENWIIEVREPGFREMKDMYTQTVFRILVLAFAGCLAVAQTSLVTKAQTPPASAADWPQWRGVDRDGMLKNAPPWPSTLSVNQLVESWRKPLGNSYSGPLVVGQHVFRCLDRSTGNEIWKANWQGAMKVPFFAASNGSWIRSTPAYSNGRIFVGGIRDVLVCLDAATGEELWRRDFPAEMGSPAPQFGCVCSPLVDAKHVYMQAGGAMHKIDQVSGKTIWQACRSGTQRTCWRQS